MEVAQKLAWKLWLPAMIALLAFIISSYFATDVVYRLGINPGPVPIGAALALLGAGYFIQARRSGWAFFLTALAILLSMATIFIELFPRVMISSLSPDFSLTIYNASSSPYTLKVMTIVALVFTPIVLIYQGWTYWVFRHRLSEKSDLHY
jgi:cytochrome d ubiquinol oxidase subunit II